MGPIIGLLIGFYSFFNKKSSNLMRRGSSGGHLGSAMENFEEDTTIFKAHGPLPAPSRALFN